MEVLYRQSELTERIPSSFDLTQIIEGKEIMTPSPTGRHQKIVFNLAFSLKGFVQKKDLGEIFISPLDVIFKEDVDRLQPDIIFVKKQNIDIVQDWIRGVPDMVVEVVSKGTVVLDTVMKKRVYERYKLPECWIVMPELESVEVFTLQNNTYELFSFAEGKGVVKSRIIEGFEIDIHTLFVP